MLLLSGVHIMHAVRILSAMVSQQNLDSQNISTVTISKLFPRAKFASR